MAGAVLTLMVLETFALTSHAQAGRSGVASNSAGSTRDMPAAGFVRQGAAVWELAETRLAADVAWSAPPASRGRGGAPGCCAVSRRLACTATSSRRSSSGAAPHLPSPLQIGRARGTFALETDYSTKLGEGEFMCIQRISRIGVLAGCCAAADFLIGVATSALSSSSSAHQVLDLSASVERAGKADRLMHVESLVRRAKRAGSRQWSVPRTKCASSRRRSAHAQCRPELRGGWEGVRCPWAG
jgi:hypothetical protein